jgi:UV excision repair protein RAD23
MSGQAEHEVVKAFVNILATQPVTFHDDFQEQPEKTLKKVPVLQVVSAHPSSPKDHQRTPSPLWHV